MRRLTTAAVVFASMALLLSGPAGATAAVSDSAVAAASVSAAQTGVGAASTRKFRIRPEAFGIHSYQSRPQVPGESFRINCKPFWWGMNPGRGRYDWKIADEFIAKVDSYGFEHVMFSFCQTPVWAAKRGGPWGSDLRQAPPARMSDWTNFVRAFVSRYKDVIDDYELWNEATSRFWWRGTPEEMVAMSVAAAKVIRVHDPSARIVSPSMQCCQQIGWFKSFFPKFIRGMAAAGWPVDVLAFHTYTDRFQGLGLAEAVTQRAAALAVIRAAVSKARVPSRIELWDTETNFLLPVTNRQSQAIVARTYLDSFRFRFARTYWYQWTQERGQWGINLRPGAPTVKTYARLQAWTSNATLKGCSTSKQLVSCTFSRKGKAMRIAYSTKLKGRASIRLDRRTRVCGVVNGRCISRRGNVSVGFEPVRIG